LAGGLVLGGCVMPTGPSASDPAVQQVQESQTKPEVMAAFQDLRRLMQLTPLASKVTYNTSPVWKYVSWTDPNNPSGDNSISLPAVLPASITVTLSPGSIATVRGWKLSWVSFIHMHYYFFLTSSWSQAEAEQAAADLRILVADGRQCYHEEVVKHLEAFRVKAKAWQALAVKPPMPEEARKHRILAENAYRDKDLDKAADEYNTVLNIYPFWASGVFNSAYIDAANDNFHFAAFELQQYLILVPNAKDAQACRDQIASWQAKMGL
jgi:hypothetical protein